MNLENRLSGPSKPAPPTQTPRGIRPDLLIAQVRNTVPFLFSDSIGAGIQTPYATQLKIADKLIQRDGLPLESMSHESYFSLCLSAHHATVASFVPTDVDVHIRFKLWLPTLSLHEIEAMAHITLDSLHWDWTPVSKRFAISPESGEAVSGHEGEWFSTAAAAYGALKRKNPELASIFIETILTEFRRQLELFDDILRSKNGIEMLKAATLIAHNAGDLSRVIDIWELPPEDELKQRLDPLFQSDLFEIVTRVNRDIMAAENHRHFALRRPRCLRTSAELLLPLGPFLDDWGKTVATHPALTPEDVGEVIESLVDGSLRLEGTVGYARALAAIEENTPGGLSRLTQLIPARVARSLKTGPLRQAISFPRSRFEAQWERKALRGV